MIPRRTPDWIRPAVLAIVSLATAAALAAPDSIDSVEKAAGDWVKMRVETARLNSEWSSQRELLESLVASTKERAGALETQRDYLRSKTAEERNEIAAATEANRKSAAAMQDAESSSRALAEKVAALRRRLPPRLSSALDLPYRSLAAENLGASDRMQFVMTILNRCVEFNRVITADEELVSVDGKNTQLLPVVYWGLSHGYAYDRVSRQAWLGRPDGDGWKWSPVANGPAAIERLEAIAQGKAEPAFIVAPAQLSHLESTGTR
ncbi:MAG TPA: DUF3450 family protein [Candidatus Didemnitutus sp.]|nr:DUF3450 family protein [Candidatus Didemnitutus sp.]